MSLARFTLNPRFPSMWRDFDDFFRGIEQPAQNTERMLVPTADVVENDKAIEIHLELPGFAPEAIDVKLEGNQLTVSATRNEEKTTENKGWLRRERSLGSMSRSFTLPNTLDGTKPEASYKHGVLTVTLPKKEEVQPRSLKVKVEA
ncbi:MAG: Hsp20/alpha crystallin family protein [Archangium sp.]|nr:Hsp20/alpha crystallin family protein [Archangium sp.]